MSVTMSIPRRGSWKYIQLFLLSKHSEAPSECLGGCKFYPVSQYWCAITGQNNSRVNQTYNAKEIGKRQVISLLSAYNTFSKTRIIHKDKSYIRVTDI